MTKPVKVMFIVTGLSRGGAEVMLGTTLRALDRYAISPCVVSLKELGPIGAEIESLGIPVFALQIGTRRGIVSGLCRLLKLVGTERPQVLQGWLPHGNLVATIVGLLRRVKVVWGIRNSALPQGSERVMTLWWVRVLSKLSRFADRVIYNSEAGRTYHESIGYDATKSQVIFNGFNVDRFRPSKVQRVRFRSMHKIETDVVVIGLVGRYHPLKDHATFLRAAGIIRQRYPQTVFLLVGRECTVENAALQTEITLNRLDGSVRLLGELGEMDTVFPALDILVSSSISEGFPTAVGEAMSCAIPCVVTDVGDSAYLVGSTGGIVAAKNAEALAAACMQFLVMGAASRTKIGDAARQRIVSQFAVDHAALRYAGVYREILVKSHA